MSQPIAVPINSAGSCQRIIVRAGNGKTYDLGKPRMMLFWTFDIPHPLFSLRVLIYKFRRRKEFQHG